MESDEAFTAGLLHDIGKLVLGCCRDEPLTLAAQASALDKVPFYRAEKPETSHVYAGGILAKHWNFPADLCDALALHHDPDKSDAHKQLVAIVHVSDIMVHMIGFSTFPAEIPPSLDNEAVAAIKLEPEHLRVIANETIQNEKAIESFINFFV
jgi:HD-like signal output (HDOD) protein